MTNLPKRRRWTPARWTLEQWHTFVISLSTSSAFFMIGYVVGHLS